MALAFLWAATVWFHGSDIAGNRFGKGSVLVLVIWSTLLSPLVISVFYFSDWYWGFFRPL